MIIKCSHGFNLRLAGVDVDVFPPKKTRFSVNIFRTPIAAVLQRLAGRQFDEDVHPFGGRVFSVIQRGDPNSLRFQ